MAFVHLHGHTTYSLLEAIGSVKKIAGKASSMGMEAVSITDYHGMYGCFYFYKACKGADVKPLLGVEMPFVVDAKSLAVRSSKQTPEPLGYLCFLAKSFAGYQSLLKLVSAAHVRHGSDMPMIDLSMIDEFVTDSYVFFGGERGLLGSMMKRGENEKKIEEVVSMLCEQVGKDNFLLELVVQDYALVPHLQKINDFAALLAERLGVKKFAGGDYRYLDEKDKEAFTVALCIKDGKKVYDMDRRKVIGDYHMMSEAEMRMLMKKNSMSADTIDSLIDETVLIADTINCKLPLGQTLFPHYATPDYVATLYEKYKDKLVE